MAQKWNLQDIVPPDRPRRTTKRAVPAERPRTIRKTSVRKTEKVPEPEPEIRPTFTAEPVRHREVPAEPERFEPRVREPRSSRKYFYSIIAILLVIGLGAGATYLLSGAKVSVTPKNQEVNVQGTFGAKLEPGAGELGYEILTLEEQGEVQMRASGQEEAKEQARGTITVYNAYSSSPQRLIKHTRFQSSKGLIYKAEDPFVVPGYTKDASGNTVPGSVTINVFAEGTGDSYNISGEERFTLPGLANSDQAKLIYADTKGGISGGFEGMRFILNEEELAAAREKLHGELRDKLLARVKTERPNGFVLFEPAVTFTYESLPPEGSGTETAIVKERARLNTPIFGEATFAPFIAKQTVPGYGGESVRLQNPGNLTFAYSNNTGTDLPTREGIEFSLAGKTRVIWNFDTLALKRALLGLNEDALLGVLSSYPSIQKAEAVIRPIWKDSFPENPEDITITEVLPGNE